LISIALLLIPVLGPGLSESKQRQSYGHYSIEHPTHRPNGRLEEVCMRRPSDECPYNNKILDLDVPY